MSMPLRVPAKRLPAFAGLLAFVLSAGQFAGPAAFGQDDALAAGPPAAGPPAAGENAATDDDGPKTGPPLPKGFIPPPEKPEAFVTVTPLMTAEQLAAAENELNRARYRDVLGLGPRDERERQIVRDWAKWRVAKLTDPALVNEKGELDRVKLADAVADLVREANRSVGPRGDPRGAKQVKEEVFAILAEELLALKDNNLVLRIQAAKILGNLELIGGGRSGAELRRFGPAIGPLLTLFETAGEDESALVAPELAVRHVAAVMLPLVARTGESVPGDVEQRAAVAFGARLAGHPEDPGWAQSGLAAAVWRMPIRNPDLARPLMTALTDADRPCEARTAAAMALVRLAAVPGDVRNDLPDALLALARDMAVTYNTAPSAESVECFRRLEWSFLPIAPSELQEIQGGAILSGTSVPGFLQATYQRVHPLVKHVAGQNLSASPSTWTPIPADLLSGVGAGEGT